MNKNHLLPVLAMLILSTFSNCSKKKGDPGPVGPQGPAGAGSYTGMINGHVIAYDQYGIRKLTGLDGVQVTLKGVSTVVTDATGYFAFNNVTTGGYTLSASGAGLGGTVLYNIPFLKDSFYTDIKMSALPTFNITSLKAYHNPGSLFDSLVITFPGDARARNIIIFANNAPGVGSGPGKYVLTYIKPLPANLWQTTLVVRVPMGDLNSVNLFYGDMVYYGVASYVVNDASMYEDHGSTQNVYNALGTVLVDSASCP